MESAPLLVGSCTRSESIFRLTPFKDIFIASGTAVGGGSAVYANTLYRAKPAYFSNPQWRTRPHSPMTCSIGVGSDARSRCGDSFNNRAHEFQRRIASSLPLVRSRSASSYQTIASRMRP